MCRNAILHHPDGSKTICTCQADLQRAMPRGLWFLPPLGPPDIAVDGYDPAACLCPVDTWRTAWENGYRLSRYAPDGEEDVFDDHWYSETIYSDEEVREINRYQTSRKVHPLTCPNGHGALQATNKGLICPECGYHQTWVWGWIADGSWDVRRIKSFGETKTMDMNARLAQKRAHRVAERNLSHLLSHAETKVTAKICPDGTIRITEVFLALPDGRLVAIDAPGELQGGMVLEVYDEGSGCGWRPMRADEVNAGRVQNE